MQFQNPANPDVHERTTGQEIIRSFDGGTPDAFVAGVGTGGTLTGVGRALRKINPDVQIYALEAAESPMLKKAMAASTRFKGSQPVLFQTS